MTSLSAGHVTGKNVYYNNNKKRFVKNIERREIQYDWQGDRQRFADTA